MLMLCLFKYGQRQHIILYRIGLTSPSTTTFAEEYPAWILGTCYTFSPDIEGNLL